LVLAVRPRWPARRPAVPVRPRVARTLAARSLVAGALLVALGTVSWRRLLLALLASLVVERLRWLVAGRAVLAVLALGVLPLTALILGLLPAGVLALTALILGRPAVSLLTLRRPALILLTLLALGVLLLAVLALVVTGPLRPFGARSAAGHPSRHMHYLPHSSIPQGSYRT
jgi:hypothetical protein